jgi:hypothetical protein
MYTTIVTQDRRLLINNDKNHPAVPVQRRLNTLYDCARYMVAALANVDDD